MLPIRSIAVFAAGCLVLGTAVHAQDTKDVGKDADNLEVTMTLLPEGAKLPDAVTRTITLPPAASSHAASSAAGLGTANTNRARRENGLNTAEEARSEGRDFGQEMRQQAAEQRENAERGKGPGDAGPPGRGGTNPGSAPPDHANPPAQTPPTSAPPASTPPGVTPPSPSTHPTPSH